MSGPKSSISYFILTAVDVDRSRVAEPSAYDVAVHRLKTAKWGLRFRTRYRKSFKPGDRILAYACGSRVGGMQFVGEAVVARASLPIRKGEVPTIDAPSGRGALVSEYCLELRSCRVYSVPVAIKDIKTCLDLVTDPSSSKWGVRLQGGAVQITSRDFDLVSGLGRGSTRKTAAG